MLTKNKTLFPFKHLESVNKLISFLFEDVNSSSLGVVRFLFGLMMVIDVFDERELQYIDTKFSDSLTCFFPLINGIRPLSFSYMGLVYFIMWAGSFGMCIGYKFHWSCCCFLIPYWYLFLMDKTTWNNHSYLYGLISLLLFCSYANYSFSVDGLIDKTIRNKSVPRWNYWIIRFQFFLLYFYAGLKKTDADWLEGHAMTTISEHWVFDPFRLFLDNKRIDFWIVHIFGFLLDLTIGFWLIIPKTRGLAILFASSFHLMNSRLFSIGQFPYVCLVTTPIFCDYAWPEKLFGKKLFKRVTEKKEACVKNERKVFKRRQQLTVFLLSIYVSIQLFLPYSHNITKGYNNWTNGLYGYSWDMMVHVWNTHTVTIKVIDHNSGKQLFLDPTAWVLTDRYSKHADMLTQYAQCLKNNLWEITKNSKNPLTNISIHADVWCSLNKRFQQRMFDPNYDLLKGDWAPFQETKWLMPILTELTPWREHIIKFRENLYNRNNQTDVLFVADFPNFTVEHYIQEDLENVTVEILQGIIGLSTSKYSITLKTGDKIKLKSGQFYYLKTISEVPSCVVYTFVLPPSDCSSNSNQKTNTKQLFHDFSRRYDNFLKALKNLQKAFGNILDDVTTYLKLKCVTCMF